MQFKHKEFNVNDLDYEIEDLFENNEENEFDFVDLDLIVNTTKKDIYLCDQNLNLKELENFLLQKGVIIEFNESVKTHLDALIVKKEFDINFIAKLMIENYKKSAREIDWISLNWEFNIMLKSEIKKILKVELSDDDINTINSFNSIEWLKFYNECMGVEADQNVIDIINSLKRKYNLSDGILNCLISYSYLKNNKKFIYNYVVKIAENIKAKGITTTKELYTHLKNISRKYDNKIEEVNKVHKQPVNEFVMDTNINIEW